MVANSAIKPIETHYKGYRFRSRLEARWAVFFDALDIEWEYEKEGYDLGEYGWYLPDFWLPIKHSVYSGAGYWIEIKGELTGEGVEIAWKKLRALSTKTKHNGLLLIGNIGDCVSFKTHHSAPLHWPEYRLGIEIQNTKQYLHELEDYKEYILMSADIDAAIIEIRKQISQFSNALMSALDAFDENGYLTGSKGGKFDAAVAAARSARFEHGETPNTYQRKGRK